MEFEKYHQGLSYSYSFGAFGTIELLKNKNCYCKAILIDPSLSHHHSSALFLIARSFVSLEAAEKVTGISSNAIKIRCNKPGSSGKDGITFEWKDITTKRHFTAKKNKSKGSNFELEICNALKEIGYKGCVTSRSESKRTDDNKIDIIDTNDQLPVNIQAKYTQSIPNYFKISSQCSDHSKPYTIIWKKTPQGGKKSQGTLAIIPVDLFYTFLKLYLTHDK